MASSEYIVSFSPKAEQHLKEINKQEARKVLGLVERMKEMPTAGAARLRHLKTTEALWRKKLGDLRVIFTVDVKRREVVIRTISRRREDTYDDIESILD